MHPLSAAPSSPPKTNVCLEDVRRSVTYHPSVWGDHFLKYTLDVTEISVAEKEQLERQKEMVRNLLQAQMRDDSLHKMQLIDAIQQLGVAYHFEQETEKYLRYMYETFHAAENENNDLHFVALRFRLLRQQGYNVPCDVFNKFIDKEGNFKDSIANNNIEGVLSLYEAAHFGVDGEDILDKAISFCVSHLESYLLHDQKKNNNLSKQVDEALNIPIHKRVIRLAARKFISIYQENEFHNEILLNFAKLDFNILQKMHQKELCDLTRWWKDLDFANKLPFARDRIVECFFWPVTIYFEPQYQIARRILAKVVAMISVIDDIYDVHGTLDELQLFTDFMIQSWDVNALEQLPQYMRVCLSALSDVYVEMEDEMEKIGTSYRVHYAKEEMKKLVRSYLEEAKWSYTKYMPSTVKEYMKVALVSGTYMALSTISLVGMGNEVTKQDFDWITSEPLIVQASSVTGRLMDDIVGSGFEKKLTAVECYMNENGCSKTEACAELEKQVKKAWKDINQECLIGATAVSFTVLVRVVNLARLMFILYGDEDGYTNATTKTKDIIQSVFVDPVTI